MPCYRREALGAQTKTPLTTESTADLVFSTPAPLLALPCTDPSPLQVSLIDPSSVKALLTYSQAIFHFHRLR